MTTAVFFSACDDDNEPDTKELTAELSVTTHGDETNETNIEFKVTLSETNNTGADISFDFNTIAGGTATATEDFIEITGQTANLVIAYGDSSATITVTIVQDTDKGFQRANAHHSRAPSMLAVNRLPTADCHVRRASLSQAGKDASPPLFGYPALFLPRHREGEFALIQRDISSANLH